MRAFIPCCLALLALGLGGLTPSDAAPDRRDRQKPKLNRLANERSPYLRQHATNPVDWYPWGDEAFAAARAQNKPVLLSIGYAACHWCHVMENESFEDVATAKVLNDSVICIKVDREERPDVDRVYLNALYALGKRGGWPMTVFLTPDRTPVWGATYVQPNRLQEVAKQVLAEWREDPERLRRKGQWVASQVQAMSLGPTVTPTRLSDRDLVENMRLVLQRRYDRRMGGFLSAKKFPPHARLLFYLADGLDLRPTELEQVALTLAKMEEGGIHDHVGGGFHRYAVDERWFLPHFEKMLYDNALLVRAYARMYAITRRERYRRVAMRALDWIEHDLKQPNGGYAASLDADTKGVEGGTYTWTTEELQNYLVKDDAGFIGNLMGARRNGNFPESGGKNVLYLPAPISAFARQNGTGAELVWMRMDRVLKRLLEVRQTRPQPRLDDKVITAWNGLLISAFADAGVAFGSPDLLQRGRDLANVILNRSRRPNGTLLRFPLDSGPEIMGFCEDYAHFTEGLLALSDATNETVWLRHAQDLCGRMIRGFEDRENGGFFETSHRGHERLIARGKPYRDNPIPSDNGTAARVCLRLWASTADPTFRDAANRTISMFRSMLAQGDTAFHATTLVGALRLRNQIEGAVAPDDAAAASAPAFRIRQDVAQIAVFVDGTTSDPGDKAKVRVVVSLDSGWHVNPENAEDGLVATSLDAGKDARLLSVVYPAPTQRTLDLGVASVPVFDGTFEITAEVECAGANPALVLMLQACDDSGTCKAPLEIQIPLP